MTDFFAMGGYAVFVWSCYGASVFGLGLAAFLSLRAHSKARALVQRLEAAQGEAR